jgi:hypothetical protein
MITGSNWNDAAPGGTINFSVWIKNPDTVQWSGLYVYMFVGPANFVPDVGDAMSAVVDTRFPRLTMPNDGITLGPGGTQPVSFSFSVPTTGVQKSNYLLNAILFKREELDVGQYLDRGLVIFGVT